jgi:hypothetical protein
VSSAPVSSVATRTSMIFARSKVILAPTSPSLALNPYDTLRINDKIPADPPCALFILNNQRTEIGQSHESSDFVLRDGRTGYIARTFMTGIKKRPWLEPEATNHAARPLRRGFAPIAD